MTQSELESFIMKFKGLLYSGKNANLNIKSEGGKVLISLSVEEEVKQHPARDGPARRRRRERRAAARAEDAAAVTAAEEVSKNEAPENVASNGPAVEENSKESTAISEEDVAPKVIPEATFVEPRDEIENVRIENYSRVVEMCSSISIIPIRNVNPNDEVIKETIRMKMEAKKVKVLEIMIFRSSQGLFTRGDVVIEPCDGKYLETTDFGIANFRILPYYGLRIL